MSQGAIDQESIQLLSEAWTFGQDLYGINTTAQTCKNHLEYCGWELLFSV